MKTPAITWGDHRLCCSDAGSSAVMLAVPFLGKCDVMTVQIWEATSKHQEKCTFGNHASAAAWAGSQGRVEQRTLPIMLQVVPVFDHNNKEYAYKLLKVIINYWHEFGPEHGFSELIDLADTAIKIGEK